AGEDAGERDVRALERADRAGSQRRGRTPERLDHLVGGLVTLATLADAAVDDLLQVIATVHPPHVGGTESMGGVLADQHAYELADLINVVARLPLGHVTGEDVARRGHPVHRVRGDAAPVALLARDAEVAELQDVLVAHEHVERREVAMEELAAMELAEHFEDAGDLAAHLALVPTARVAAEVHAQVAMARVLERQAVEDSAVREHERERVEDADRARMAVEQLPEVGLAQPAVDARAGLDAHDLFAARHA